MHEAGLALDMDKPLQDNPAALLGTEYSLPLGSQANRALALRLGLNTRTDTGGLSYGLGWREKNLSIDYAIEPFGDLSLNHRVGLTLGF
ncbi:MAG: hypothetical protein HY547_08430 [Elusimicrobia bacterium]|nr:hypothetical protein [Elusimicrobiota bacterium]